jgi:hypothetical protein
MEREIRLQAWLQRDGGEAKGAAPAGRNSQAQTLPPLQMAQARVSMASGKAARPPRVLWKRGSDPFAPMMKAYGTFDIRCSVICAAAARLAVLPAELRLICP